MKQWSLWLGTLVALGWSVACDQDFEARDDADVEDNETISFNRGALGGAFGADPESRAFVEGAPSYTPASPGLVEAVVLGAAAGARSDGRVLVDRPEWEGGPLLEARGADAAALARGVSPPEPEVDWRAELGSWLMVAGRAVIAEGPGVDAGWAAREPSDERRPPLGGEVFMARLPLVLARLPAEVRGVIGAEVRVFDREREVCIARIAGLELEAKLVHEAFGPWSPAYSERELLRRGLRSVVATLEPLGGAGSCGDGVVAVGVRAPSPRLFRELALTPSMHRKAVAAMCALPAWQDAARDDGERRPGPWSAQCRELSATVAVRVYETRLGQRFVLVSTGIMHAGFASRDGALDNAWVHVSAAPVEALIDIHGDGTPELVLAASGREPAGVAGTRFAGDLSEPGYLPDWTPLPPRRMSVGGFATPDYSVFKAK